MYADDFRGVNGWFLDLLFELMPCVVGKTLWRGSSRCGRNPKFSRGQVPVGIFEELVTVSDMALLVWAFENYYEVAKQVPLDNSGRDDKQLEKEKGVAPKWTRQASGKYNGWTADGKAHWNYYMDDMRKRMGSGNPMVEAFKREFESEWQSRFGLREEVPQEMDVIDDLVCCF